MPGKGGHPQEGDLNCSDSGCLEGLGKVRPCDVLIHRSLTPYLLTPHNFVQTCRSTGYEPQPCDPGTDGQEQVAWVVGGGWEQDVVN